MAKILPFMTKGEEGGQRAKLSLQNRSVTGFILSQVVVHFMNCNVLSHHLAQFFSFVFHFPFLFVQGSVVLFRIFGCFD